MLRSTCQRRPGNPQPAFARLAAEQVGELLAHHDQALGLAFEPGVLRRIEQAAQGVDLLDEQGRVLPAADDGAGAAAPLQQAARLQFPDRLAHGLAADPEPVAEFIFRREAVPGGVASRHDFVGQGPANLLVKGRRRHCSFCPGGGAT